MNITSPAFDHNERIPERYTCDGENTSPPLVFSEIPLEAQNLVLIVDDPDAPAGTWVHWLVFNIPVETGFVDEDSVPKGIEGVTSFGNNDYGGPCPPSGTHRYFFKLYALDTELPENPEFTKSSVLEQMDSHVVAKAELVGLYSRD